MISALDHVVIGVSDLDDARHDYDILLGLQPSWEGVHPGRETRNVLYRLDNTYIELLGSEIAMPPSGGSREGILALALRTENLGEASQELKDLLMGAVIAGSGRNESTGAVRRWRRRSSIRTHHAEPSCF